MLDYEDLLVWASFEDTLFSGGHVAAACGGVEIFVVEEEAVGRVLAGGGISEAVGAMGRSGEEGRVCRLDR